MGAAILVVAIFFIAVAFLFTQIKDDIEVE